MEIVFSIKGDLHVQYGMIKETRKNLSNTGHKTILTMSSYLQLMAKRLWLTILLSILVSGIGHIYLGFIKRGIIILIVAIILGFSLPFLIPMPFSWIILVGYWLWQIWDAYKHYQKLKVGQTQATK
jgi:TM2 domain-containing membrane protein YozV